MRYLVLLLSMLCGAAVPVVAQVSIGVGIGLPNMNIGINYPVYPQFQQVPGYPVYYAPQVSSNYFFYDGMYWVYANDSWYASSWYNGPWALVAPLVVPVYILRVPVRYYREPPIYFRGWRPDAPPRWDDHWGDDWRRQRNGWDHWNRNAVPPPAPLPVYQRQYSGGRYPTYEQQRTITTQNYHYQPHEAVVQQHYQRYMAPTGPAVTQQKASQHDRPQQAPDHDQGSQAQNENVPRPPPPQDRPPPRQPPSGQDHQERAPPAQQGEMAPKEPPVSHQEPSQQHHQQQQSSGQEYGPPAQGEKESKQPKQDQGKEEGGDKVQDKEGQRDNR